jgi:magnesium transporter
MSPVLFRMRDTATCGNAIITQQEHHEELNTVYYLYVTDDRESLVGVVSMRQLLVHPPNTPLVSIMNRDVITVSPTQDQEEAARYAARYDLLALPVVDEKQHLLGIITIDDVVDVIQEEAAEDMMLMAGVHGDVPELAHGTAVQFARQRAGWLLATAFGGIVAERLTTFGGAGLEVEVLAGFIPVVMGMGGNVGIQSTTLAVRGLATGSVQVGGAANFVWREVQVGLLLGVLYGLLLGTYGLVTGWPDPSVSIVVGSSVLIAISLGSLLGSGLPVLLQRLGFDPAVATGPFVTTGVDIMGIFVYFQVARLLMSAA